MEKFKNLSIADLKSAEEYLEKLKKEHLENLKKQGIDSKDDYSYTTMDKLGYDIHTHLFGRLMKLKNK